MCLTKSSTILEDLHSPRLKIFQTSSNFNIKSRSKENAQAGGLSRELILPGKSLGCARGMNTTGPKMNLKGFDFKTKFLCWFLVKFNHVHIKCA